MYFFSILKTLKNIFLSECRYQFLEIYSKSRIKRICHKSLYSSIYWVFGSQSNAFARPCAFSLVCSLGMISLHYASCLPHFVPRFGCCFRCPSAFLLLMGFVGRLPRARAPPDISTKWKQDENFGFNKHTHNMQQELEQAMAPKQAQELAQKATESSSWEGETNRLFSGRRILF